MSAIAANPKTKPNQATAKPPRNSSQRRTAEAKPEISLPPAQDWRTTDEDEINRRRLRAREGTFVIRNTDTRFPVFSNFSVGSGSGLTYAVEIRDVANRQFACACQDFRKNGLGTCKHVEAVLLHLEARFKRLFAQAAKDGSPRVDIAPDDAADTLRVERGRDRLPKAMRDWFAADGRAARPLHPLSEAPTPLSAQELAKAQAHREVAARKLKMARLLADGGLAEEAREPLLNAALALSRALAVEARLPEPGAVDDLLPPPLAAAWGKHAIAIQDFLAQPEVHRNRAMRAMEELLGIPDDCPF